MRRPDSGRRIAFSKSTTLNERVHHALTEGERTRHPRWCIDVKLRATHHRFDVLIAALERVVQEELQEERLAATRLEPAIDSVCGKLRRAASANRIMARRTNRFRPDARLAAL